MRPRKSSACNDHKHWGMWFLIMRRYAHSSTVNSGYAYSSPSMPLILPPVIKQFSWIVFVPWKVHMLANVMKRNSVISFHSSPLLSLYLLHSVDFNSYLQPGCAYITAPFHYHFLSRWTASGENENSDRIHPFGISHLPSDSGNVAYLHYFFQVQLYRLSTQVQTSYLPVTLLPAPHTMDPNSCTWPSII